MHAWLKTTLQEGIQEVQKILRFSRLLPLKQAFAKLKVNRQVFKIAREQARHKSGIFRQWLLGSRVRRFWHEHDYLRQLHAAGR